MKSNALDFVESAALPQRGLEGAPVVENPVNLDKLPAGIVSGNALIDFSAAAAPTVRSGVSTALLFASRVADAAMGPDDDEDNWLAAYKTNLRKLGFFVPQTSIAISRFKKQGVSVHKALIPFLTIAFGGASLGPVILAALQNLQDVDRDQPWITIFDRESRKFTAREMHFAAVASDASETTIRHVVARLTVDKSETSILFFRITSTTAEFESATTTMSANNSLLAVLEPKLRQRMESEIDGFIAEAKTSKS
jgi:hypothetical protein